MKAAFWLLALTLAAIADKKDVLPLAGRDVPIPARISGVAPVIPQMARDVGLQAMIVLQVTLSAAGRPTEIRVLRGVPLLDAAAIDAVKTWRYEPTMIDGAAQRVDVIEAIPFFSGAEGLAEALSRIATDRGLPSHLRVEAITKLGAPPAKVRKAIVKALQKLVSDPDAAVAKAAATALAAMDGEVR